MSGKQISVSIDIDWASDEIIEYAAGILLEHKIKSTWFITHNSEAVRRLFSHKNLFRIGIHPNLLPNSTQGKTVPEVMDYLLDIYPASRIMRTHGLYQSSPFFAHIIEKYSRIKIDVSLFIPGNSGLRPHKLFAHPGYPKRFIYRIPFFWEDDFAMISPRHDFRFDINNFPGTGVKIFNFHPVHIALNSSGLTKYVDLKRRYPLRKIKLKDLHGYRQKKKKGIEDFLMAMVNNKNIKFIHLEEWLKQAE